MRGTGHEGSETEASLSIETADRRWDVWFRTSAPTTTPGSRPPGSPSPGSGSRGLGDAVVTAGLLPAMRLGEDLAVDGAASNRLLRGTGTVQDVLVTWDRALRPRAPWYRRAEVTASSVGPSAAPGGRGTAAFFTAGVDSFHTAVVHRGDLDALVFVHGFDVALDSPVRAEVGRRVAEAASDLGLPLVEVETNLRALGDGSGVPWDDYHGAALATVAHVLSGRFERVLVPATHTYGHLEGLGSHPLLDPLWSTEAVEIVHVGAAATRADKIRRIVEEPAARRHLRVCWENRDARYNCGACEKCVRTGVAVRVAGAEGRFPTVVGPSLATVARIRVTGRGADWHDLRTDLVRTGSNPRLRRAIDVALARHQLARWPRTRWLVR